MTTDQSIRKQVQRRLDELFREDNEWPELAPSPAGLEAGPLKSLKELIVSIDREAFDKTVSSLQEETERLKVIYRNDRVVFLFLELISSLANYIRINKRHAHPDAVNLLGPICDNLQRLLTEDVAEKEKKKALIIQINRVKKLKQKIAREKEKGAIKREARRPSQEGGKDLAPRSRGITPHEAFALALEEIKEDIEMEFKAIKAEFQALRTELRSELRLWREGH